jgi:hypothetical protein
MLTLGLALNILKHFALQHSGHFLSNAGVADFSYEIERGRRAERASPSQFHS